MEKKTPAVDKASKAGKRRSKTHQAAVWPGKQLARRMAKVVSGAQDHRMMNEQSAERREEEKRLAKLAASGLLTLGSGKKLEPFEPLRSPGKSLSEALLEDRNDRF